MSRFVRQPPAVRARRFPRFRGTPSQERSHAVRLIESEPQQVQVAARRTLFWKNTTAVPSGVIPVANSGSLLFVNCSGSPVPSAACHQRLNTPLRFELKMIRLPSRVHSGCWSSPGSSVKGVSDLSFQVPDPNIVRLIAAPDCDALSVGREPGLEVGARRRSDGLLLARSVDPHQCTCVRRNSSRQVHVHERPVIGDGEIPPSRPSCTHRREQRQHRDRTTVSLEPIEIEGNRS